MSATAPLAARCARCRRRVLEVRRDFQLGVLIGAPRLDPVRLDRDQVLACVLVGIRLWQIREHAGTTTTSSRSRWWPRQPVDGHTAPEHACARVWDAPALDLAPDEVTYPEQPPF
ncbi:hypothetical protein [Microbacterium sp. NPDC089188]|uniref:hypothetical protein n=1 Tax=Microbacterium sp. NPDC089188 TaxID=3154971 RepID=UPI00343AF212